MTGVVAAVTAPVTALTTDPAGLVTAAAESEATETGLPETELRPAALETGDVARAGAD